MAKFKCAYCEKEFKKSWLKWLFTTPFHWFGKRYTRCPHCHGQSYMKPMKKSRSGGMADAQR